MTQNHLSRPSKLCLRCKENGFCPCLCHVTNLIQSEHELVQSMGEKIQVEKVTKFESDYNILDKIKSRLGFSV